MTRVTVDGVVRGNGHASDSNAAGGQRGQAMTRPRELISQPYQRAAAFLFGRRTDAKGVTIQVYRPAGRPQYVAG